MNTQATNSFTNTTQNFAADIVALEFEKFERDGDVQALAKSRAIVDYRSDDLSASEMRHLLALRTITRRLAVHSFHPARTPAAWRDAALYILPSLSAKNAVLRLFASSLATFLIAQMNAHVKKTKKQLPLSVRESFAWELVRAEVAKVRVKNEIKKVGGAETLATTGRALADAIVNEKVVVEKAVSADPVRRRKEEVRQEDREAVDNMISVLNGRSVPDDAEVVQAPQFLLLPAPAGSDLSSTTKLSRAERKRQEKAEAKAKRAAGNGFVLVGAA